MNPGPALGGYVPSVKQIYRVTVHTSRGVRACVRAHARVRARVRGGGEVVNYYLGFCMADIAAVTICFWLDPKTRASRNVILIKVTSPGTTACAVGAAVGAALGAVVAFAVGTAVGTAVGAALGRGVASAGRVGVVAGNGGNCDGGTPNTVDRMASIALVRSCERMKHVGSPSIRPGLPRQSTHIRHQPGPAKLIS